MSSTPICEHFMPPPAALAHLMGEVEPLQARYDAYRPRLRFLACEVNGRCESLPVDNGLLMLVMNVGLAQSTEVQLRGQGIVEFHYRLAGSLEMYGAWGHLRMRELSMLLWRQPAGYDDVGERIGAGRPREISVSLYCDPKWLAKQLDAYCAGALLDFLSGDEGESAGAPLYRLYDLSGRMINVLNDIIASPFQGPLRYLYAKGKALELLCGTLSMLAARDSAVPKTGLLRERDRRNIAAAYEILQTEYAAPPDLKSLAQRVGINTTKLCAGFKQEFGATVSDCVRKLRLEHARALLESSELPIGQVALAVGYHHHSTFTAAFADYFGVTPKRISEQRGMLRTAAGSAATCFPAKFP